MYGTDVVSWWHQFMSSRPNGAQYQPTIGLNEETTRQRFRPNCLQRTVSSSQQSCNQMSGWFVSLPQLPDSETNRHAMWGKQPHTVITIIEWGIDFRAAVTIYRWFCRFALSVIGCWMTAGGIDKVNQMFWTYAQRCWVVVQHQLGTPASFLRYLKTCSKVICINWWDSSKLKKTKETKMTMKLSTIWSKQPKPLTRMYEQDKILVTISLVVQYRPDTELNAA